jgi:hypothetical protein
VVGHAMEVDIAVDQWDSSSSFPRSLLSDLSAHPLDLWALVRTGPQ